MFCQSQSDMFDINGNQKHSEEAQEARIDIIKELAVRHPKAICAISDSAGKDSQAMKLEVLKYWPHDRIVVIHADMSDECEHKGVQEHIHKFTPENIPVYVVRNPYRTLLDQVLIRGKWMSAAQRFCTSDFKTSQIDKEIRRIARERDAGVVINCLGLRADESRFRADKPILITNSRLTTKTRMVFDWLPVHHYSDGEIFDAIYAAGQHPHPAYGKRGELNQRLSCTLCVLAGKRDLTNGARNYPDHYHNYIAIEQVINHTVFTKRVRKQAVPVSIAERIGVEFDQSIIGALIPPLIARRETLLANKAAKLKEKAALKKTRQELKFLNSRDTKTKELFA